MQIFNINKRYRLFLRYKTIANIFFKHGLGFVIEKLGLMRFVPFKKRYFKSLPYDDTSRKKTLAERIKSALEELGPTFVKFGQLLSLRPDMVPEALVKELAKLQDCVEPFAFDEALRIIEEEYNQPYDKYFTEIIPEPIGSASISQVHKAKLLDGTEVIIKVRRRGIDKVIDYDIEILFNFARMLMNNIPEIQLYEPVRMVEEFAKHIKKELDFTIEAQNCERFMNNFKDDKTVHIPKVYSELTTPKIMVMEYINGIKADHVDRLKAAGFDLKKLALHGSRAFFKMILIDGLFHGDPHPGNIFIRPDGAVAFIDFGVTGKLNDEMQMRIIHMFIGLMTKDVNKIVKNLLIMGVLPENIDVNLLKYEIEEFIEEHYNKPLKRLEIGTIMLQTIKIAVKHKIRVPSEYSLLSKATLEIEAIGRKLDPNYETAKAAEPFLHELTKRILWPRDIIKILLNLGEDLKELLFDTPKTFNSIFKKIEKGKLGIEFHHIGLEDLIKKLDTVSNRLSVSLIVSALIVSSGLIVTAEKGPFVYGVPLIGFSGFVIAGVFGLFLVISMMRSGKL